MNRIGEFGKRDGEPVVAVELVAPGGGIVSICSIGASIRDFVAPLADGSSRRVVLGFEDPTAYADNPAYLGAMVGRYANRIGGGRFRLDGREHTLPINDGGRNTLHGGPKGFSRRNWTLEATTESSVTLSLVSPDGDEGFPGRVVVRCTYTLTEAATLTYEITATADAPTVFNVANHAYFTMNDGGDSRDHRLRLLADFYTPCDDSTCPTGAVLPVDASHHDFRSARRIADDFDVNFAIAAAPGESVVAAEVIAPDGRLALEVETDRPGIQLYTGQFLGPSAPPLGGLVHKAHAAFCLEAQDFPDAPNRRQFPSTRLAPGETYRQRTVYRFLAR